MAGMDLSSFKKLDFIIVTEQARAVREGPHVVDVPRLGSFSFIVHHVRGDPTALHVTSAPYDDKLFAVAISHWTAALKIRMTSLQHVQAVEHIGGPLKKTY